MSTLGVKKVPAEANDQAMPRDAAYKSGAISQPLTPVRATACAPPLRGTEIRSLFHLRHVAPLNRSPIDRTSRCDPALAGSIAGRRQSYWSKNATLEFQRER